MSTRLVVGYAVAFLAFVTLPLVLWLVGVRSEPDPLVGRTEVPELSLENLANGDYTQAVGDWVTEQSPLRKWGARVEAWVDIGVFGDSANPHVAIGRDDWLFYKDSLDLQTGCEGDSLNFQPDQIVGTVSLIADVVRASGREFWFTEVPGKSQVYPDKLTHVLTELGTCSRERRTAVRDQLASYDWYVDTWSAVDAFVDGGPPQPLYFPQDTHWTTRGGAVLTEQVVTAVQPGLWDPSSLRADGTDQIVANLAYQLTRRAATNEATHWTIERDGVRVVSQETIGKTREGELVPEDSSGAMEIDAQTGQLQRTGEWVMIDNRPVRAFQTSSAGAELIPDRTLLIHDSFSWFAMAQMPLFFEELTMANLYNTFDTPWLAEGVRDAERIMIEMGEEYVWDYVHAGTPFVAKVIDGVSNTLPSVPIPADDLVEKGKIHAVGDGGDRWTIDDKSGSLEFSAPSGAADRRLLIFDVTTPQDTVAQMFDGTDGDFPVESVQQQAIPAGTHPVVFDMTSRGPRFRLEPGKEGGVEISNVRIIDITVGTPPNDASPMDAGRTEAGRTDSGSADPGTTDAGPDALGSNDDRPVNTTLADGTAHDGIAR